MEHFWAMCGISDLRIRCTAKVRFTNNTTTNNNNKYKNLMIPGFDD